MVYVKINQEILDLIGRAKLKKLLGCERYWDKKIISYEDLDLLIAVLNKRISKYTITLNIATANAKLLKSDPAAIVEELIALKSIVDRSQVLFINEHFWNTNLKTKSDWDETKDEDDQGIVDAKDQEPVVINKEQTFGEVKKRFEQEHPISEADVKKNETIMNRIKARVERKKYNAMVGHPDDGFNSEVRQGVKQYQESLAFGSSFITLMFLGFILGFYIGKYAFGLSEIHWYICSIVIGITTMVLETVLYIIKMERIESNERKKEKKADIYKID